MKNNTVVVACDKNYFWGTFILIASMRAHQMDEPVFILQHGFTDWMKTCIQRFGDVEIVDASAQEQNMTCLKAVAMLHVKTDYITWADCDGFFSGNCSDKLYCPDPNTIHVRMRSKAENIHVFKGRYAEGEPEGGIPKSILDIWQADIGENTTPALQYCVSACYLSVHKSQQRFLELWGKQMQTILPKTNVGVVNMNLKAYFQLDESVLNSVLCFMKDAPKVSAVYQLDKDPNALYYHIVRTPKPWQHWSGYSLQFHAQIMALMRYAREHGILEGIPLPWQLNEKYAFFHRTLTFWCYAIRIKRRLMRCFK